MCTLIHTHAHTHHALPFHSRIHTIYIHAHTHYALKFHSHIQHTLRECCMYVYTNTHTRTHTPRAVIPLTFTYKTHYRNIVRICNVTTQHISVQSFNTVVYVVCIPLTNKIPLEICRSPDLSVFLIDTGTPLTLVKNCLKVWGLPCKRV